MVAVPFLEVAPAPLGAIGQAIAEDLTADVLLALVDGELAWSSFEALAIAMAKGDEAVRVAVRAAESLGLVTYWPECPQTPSYTLTPEAADRLGVAIGPDGRWHRSADPRADGNYSRPGPARRADPGDDETESGGTFGWCVDPRAIDPATFAEEAEEIARLASNSHVARLLNGTAMPARVIGIRPPWPVTIEAGICPACGSGPSEVGTVCIACDRSGLDLLILGRRGR
jgi:hypothetical protein